MLKNDTGKESRIESADDVVAIVNSNLDSANYVLSVTDDTSFGG